MEEDKNIFGTVMFDILALSITLLLSTVNVLYFIFMISSCVLVLNAYKDIKKYKLSNQKVQKKTNIIILLCILSLASLLCVILTYPLKMVELAYSVYGIQIPVLIYTGAYSFKEYLTNKKAKVNEVEVKEEKADFVVEEMGTSLDREEKKDLKDQNNIEEPIEEEIDNNKGDLK